MKAEAVNAAGFSSLSSTVGVGKRCNLDGEEEGEEEGEDVALVSLYRRVFGDVRSESGALIQVRHSLR